MEETDVLVAFQLSDSGLRSEFRNFLSDWLEEKLTQVFNGSVTTDQLDELKQKASSLGYEDDHPSDGIVIVEHDTLGLDVTTF